jgi:3-phosphoglycerate kinase
MEEFASGTRAILDAMASMAGDATTVVCGGDTVGGIHTYAYNHHNSICI